MKKQIFFLILLLSSLASYAQGGWIRPNYSHGTLMKGISADSAVAFPTGCGSPSTVASINKYTKPIKKANQYLDTCSHKFWFYDPKTDAWDSIHVGFEGGRFGFSGEDVTASATRSFDMGGNVFTMSGFGTASRFVQTPGVTTRRLRMVNTNGTDSGYVEVNGSTAALIRQVKLATNSTATGTYSSLDLLDGGGNSKITVLTGNGINESVLTTDTNKVSFARRLVGSGVYGSIVEIHDNYQDSWARDSLIWRMLNRSSEFFLENNVAEIYAGQNEINLINPTGITIEPYKQNLYIDSLQHTLTATAKMMTWDSVGGRVEARAIPSSGTWTPTLANIGNTASRSVSTNAFHFLRIENEVSFSGTLTVTPTAGTTVTQVSFTLPIASNLAFSYDMGGTATAVGSTYNSGLIYADAATDKGWIEFVSSNTSAHTVTITGHYIIK